MSNKNSFEGLQFRIMETLEKQPNHAPLMAAEIADRLHATEYRDEMKDNVVFRVTRAVHGMKERGKIIVADARGPGGQLCYQLPQRLKFPPANNRPPVNPVLTPEVAQQIKTVEPAPEKKGPGQIRYAKNPGDALVELLNKSPHPLLAAEITEQMKPVYPPEIADNPVRFKPIIATNLHHLSRVSRRIRVRRITGYGAAGARFEYFTNRTGTDPHPLSLKKSQTVTAAPAPEPTPAPRPSEAWAEPAPAAKPVARASSAPGLFRPGAQKVELVQLNVSIPEDTREAWKAAAERFGVPLVQLITEAMDYALEHAETE